MQKSEPEQSGYTQGTVTSSIYGAVLNTAGLNTDIFDGPEDILCGLSCSHSGLSRDFWLL